MEFFIKRIKIENLFNTLLNKKLKPHFPLYILHEKDLNTVKGSIWKVNGNITIPIDILLDNGKDNYFVDIYIEEKDVRLDTEFEKILILKKNLKTFITFYDMTLDDILKKYDQKIDNIIIFGLTKYNEIEPINIQNIMLNSRSNE